MVTKEEALKLARDWIAESPPYRPVSAGKMISIIDRALAQPAQDPVAWMHPSGGVLQRLSTGLERDTYTIPLYTTPPQRPWVGLTDEDFQPVVQKAMMYYGYEPKHSTLTSGAGFYVLVRDIEAALKEKNT